MADTFIPQTLDELTPEWLTAVLRERGVLARGAVTSVRHEILGDGEGFVGVLARLFLEIDTDEEWAPRTLIAKLPTPVKQNRAMGELLGAYEREILFYEELAPELPMRVPRTYYSALDRDRASENQEAIVAFVDRMPLWIMRLLMRLAMWIAGRKKRRYVLLMEDLAHARVGDQVKGGEPEDCRQALRAMARTHARLWESSLLEGRFWLTRQDLQCRTRHLMFLDSRAVFSKRFAYLMADGLAPLAAWLDVHGAEVARRLHGGAPQTLIHGDFRFDNIFFEDGSQDPIVMIDWQLAGRGAAAYDVAYLLGGALPAEAERLTVERLLREYHAALVEHGVKDYDYASFVLDYERGLLTILMTIASTDNMEMGEGRGADLIRLWVERLVARARDVDLDGLL